MSYSHDAYSQEDRDREARIVATDESAIGDMSADDIRYVMDHFLDCAMEEFPIKVLLQEFKTTVSWISYADYVDEVGEDDPHIEALFKEYSS